MITGLFERENFGWLPDIPDHRDRLFLPKVQRTAILPTEVDLTKQVKWPEVYDQGDLGSCVAQSVAACIEYAMRRRANDPAVSDFLEKDRVFSPSRLFIYYGAREIIGLTAEDSGSHIRDAMKVVYNIGAPRETGWKHDIAKFAKKPPTHSYKSARFHKITSYRSVAVDVQACKAALAEGFPVIVGVAVFPSFFSDPKGNIPMPSWSEPMLGGHAIVLTGYDDQTQRFRFRNSWGLEWGSEGHGSIPYGYIGNRNLGDDYWLLTDESYKERM